MSQLVAFSCGVSYFPALFFSTTGTAFWVTDFDSLEFIWNKNNLDQSTCIPVLCQKLVPKRRLWYLPMKLPHELSPLRGSVFSAHPDQKNMFQKSGNPEICHQMIESH